MVRNYLKIALRNLVRNKAYSLITISGLALGMSMSLLILLFVSHELSFDKFHKNHENIFGVNGNMKLGEREFNFSNMSQRLGDALKENCKSVVDVGRINNQSSGTFETDILHRHNENTGVIFVDEGFFRIFNFKILQGEATSLSKPYTIFITSEMSKKYFGNINPIGKTLKWNKKYDLEVVGIVEKNPSNSSIAFNFVGSLPSIIAINKIEYPAYYTKEKLDKISTGDCETYLKLDNKISKNNAQNILRKITKPEPNNENLTFNLYQYSSSYLGANDHEINAKMLYIYVFSGIAILILLLAIINFINLTTARAAARAKEVGIRKTIGANQKGLAWQFYIESTLMTIISLFVGLVLFSILRPAFFQIMDLNIDSSFFTNPYFLIVFIVIIFISILLSGSYPAFILSKFKPVEVLKGNMQGKEKLSVRQFLTVFQLTVSVALIFCSLVIYNQVKTMRTKNLGLNKDQVLTIDLDKRASNKNQALINSIVAIKGIEGVSGSQNKLFEQGFNLNTITKAGEKDESKNVPTIIFRADGNFADLFEMKWLIKPIKMPTDLANKVILNETTAKALDKNISRINFIDMGEKVPNEVIGVVKDFNYVTTKSKIEPLLIKLNSNPMEQNFLNIKISKSVNLDKTLASIKAAYNSYKVEDPFNYSFADTRFDSMFKAEDRIANMFGIFTGIAIFIACLGLLGLVTFIVEKKTKEIGIRKVLGASIPNILFLISKDFVKLVLIANAIAFPIAYYFMHKWLQDFNFRTELNVGIFVISVVIALSIALLTIGLQAVKAAIANPVESLRTE